MDDNPHLQPIRQLVLGQPHRGTCHEELDRICFLKASLSLDLSKALMFVP